MASSCNTSPSETPMTALVVERKNISASTTESAHARIMDLQCNEGEAWTRPIYGPTGFSVFMRANVNVARYALGCIVWMCVKK